MEARLDGVSPPPAPVKEGWASERSACFESSGQDESTVRNQSNGTELSGGAWKLSD